MVVESTTQEFTNEKDEDDAPDIVVQFRTVGSPELSLLQSHSGWSRPLLADFAASLHNVMLRERDPIRSVRRMLSSRFNMKGSEYEDSSETCTCSVLITKH